MKLALIPSGQKGNWQWLTAEAVAAGMERVGDEVLWCTGTQRSALPPPADVDGVLVWAWRNAIRYRQQGYDVLLMERAYLGDRFTWTSLGWNGLNNRARFPNVDDGGARFREHFGDLMKPWRPAGQQSGYALLLGQVPSDSAIRCAGVRFEQWALETARELKARGWEVRFRAHPRCPRLQIPGVERLPPGDIERDLDGAGLAVTLNSNAGVLAVLYGTATVTMDEGAMAYDVTAHDLERPITTPDRAEWAARVAWSQWLLEEVAEGPGWPHVRAAHPSFITGD